MKICLFGGTFDPVHNGHISMAKKAKEQFNLDKVIWMPAGESYFKENVLPARYRLQMVKLAMQNHPGMEVSDMEILRTGPSYTFETLLALKEKYSKEKIFFLLGADSLMALTSWMKFETILKTADLIVAHRQTDVPETFSQKLITEYDARIHMMEYDNQISSTNIRKMIHEDDCRYEGMIPKSVARFIKENNLYKV